MTWARVLSTIGWPRKSISSCVPGVVVRVDDGRGRVIEIARQAAWTKADNRVSVDAQFRTRNWAPRS